MRQHFVEFEDEKTRFKNVKQTIQSTGGAWHSVMGISTVRGDDVVMSRSLDKEKVAQMAVFFLERAPGKRMPYIKLIKLLYLADREALKRWNVPLTGGAYFSLPYGPIVSGIKDLITDDPDSFVSNYWKRYIETIKSDVKLIENSGQDSVSIAEQNLLKDIQKKYGRYNKRQLVKLTQKLPEYKDPCGSCIPITYEEILEAVGKSKQEASMIAKEIEDINSVHSILGCSSGG